MRITSYGLLDGKQLVFSALHTKVNDARGIAIIDVANP